MSTHPIPDIPQALQSPYSGPLQARGQFPLPLTSDEPGVTDVRTQSQAVWIYLCAILQYYEDDMAAREGTLYGGKTQRPSALILYTMGHVNPASRNITRCNGITSSGRCHGLLPETTLVRTSFAATTRSRVRTTFQNWNR